MRFDKYLTPAERVQAWRNGMTYKLASMEVLPSEFHAMCKKASLMDMIKGLALTAVVTGIPLGGVAYMIDDQTSNSSAKNTGLRKKRDYYRDLAAQIKQTLEKEQQTNGNPIQ